MDQVPSGVVLDLWGSDGRDGRVWGATPEKALNPCQKSLFEERHHGRPE
jgi:hypothetical protein